MKVIFMHLEAFNAMIYLCITNAFGKINLLQRVTKLEWLVLRVNLISLPWLKCLMISLFCFLEFAKDFFKTFFTYTLLCFRGDFYLSFFIIVSEISFLF